MSLFFSAGSADAELSAAEAEQGLFAALDRLGPRHRVLAVPPDLSRVHSRAGELTQSIYRYYGDALRAVLPALGTHAPMRREQIERMFGSIPLERFRVHDWRRSVVTLGEVPAAFLREQSEGRLDYAWPAQVNRLLIEGESGGEEGGPERIDGARDHAGRPFDLILSVGQVVPHEVIGMANYNKNILVGTGGAESINRSHYLGAVYGMERIMGRADNPVRRVLNYASDHFLRELPLVYVLTVVGRAADGRLALRGLFVGDDPECFEAAAALSLQVNFVLLEQPIQKAVVYLDPHEFHSTWLGNKAIYRTRMALADGAELIIVAPGVREFGEDPRIDLLIRRYGYRGTPATLEAVARDAELAADLSAAAHLIHGSSEGRFGITYCPGRLSADEITGVGFAYAELNAMLQRYDPARLRPGYNAVRGEEIFFVGNPGLGLWAHGDRFTGPATAAPASVAHAGERR